VLFGIFLDISDLVLCLAVRMGQKAVCRRWLASGLHLPQTRGKGWTCGTTWRGTLAAATADVLCLNPT